MKELEKISSEELYTRLIEAAGELMKKASSKTRAACIFSPEELAGEAWIIFDRRAENFSGTLDELVKASVDQALTQAYRFNSHSVGGNMGTVEVGDMEIDLGEIAEATTADGPEKRPTENAALRRLTLADVAADAKDLKIISALSNGLSIAEAARSAGIHLATVYRRLKAMQERLTDAEPATA